MKILRFLKSNWYISLILALIIIIIILPKNRSNEGTINYNTNHTYPDKISVYVEGEVIVEGKMYFYSTDTVLDLLNASGVTDYSNTTGLSLTEVLVDGLTYVIDIDSDNEKSVEITNKSTSASSISSTSTKTSSNTSDLVNINQASQADLETLPSIGSVRAKNIIAYRESNGNFSTIDEIKNVSGITDKIYDQIKDYITC